VDRAADDMAKRRALMFAAESSDEGEAGQFNVAGAQSHTSCLGAQSHTSCRCVVAA